MDIECTFCKLVHDVDGRRFYLDAPKLPFIIIENQRTLCPLLIFKEHVQNPNSLSDLVLALSQLNQVCRRLYLNRYTLRIDNLLGHFTVYCSRLLDVDVTPPVSQNNTTVDAMQVS